MGQSIANLNLKVRSLLDSIEEKGSGLVQQCLSTPHFLCFQVRFKGKTFYFYIGRGAQYQGFDTAEVKPSADLRIQDRFLQYARKYWRGMQISKVSSEHDERCLLIEGYFKKEPVKVWFFWRGRDLFFAHALKKGEGIYFYKSWVGKCSLNSEYFESLNSKEVFSDVGYGNLSSLGLRKGDIQILDYLKAFSSSADKESESKGKSKKEKTVQKIKNDLAKFQILEYLETQTEKDLTEVKRIGEGRFSVSFKGLEGHFKKREFLFNKIKAWKKSRDFLEKRLKDLEEGVGKSRKTPSQRPSFGKTIQPIWKEDKKKQAITKETNFIELSYKGWRILLGRTALENDFIRKNLAKKDDLWLHLDGYKSGHMFIKLGKNALEFVDYQILASALVELNGIDIQDIPIIYTQVKNLKGVKGVAGMVNYKKEKHIVVHFDQEWRQKLTAIEVTADG